MNYYDSIKKRFLEKLGVELYRDKNDKFLQIEKINLYLFYKIFNSEKYDKFISALNERKSFNLGEQRINSLEEIFSQEEIDYYTKHKDKIKKTLEKILIIIVTTKLSLELPIEYKNTNKFEYKKDKKIQDILNNGSIFLLDTKNGKIVDQIVLLYISCDEEITIVTSDENKKYILEDYINNKDLNVIKKDLEVKLNNLEIECIKNKKYHMKIEDYNLNKEMSDEIYDEIYPSILKIENILNISIGKEINDFMYIIKKEKYKNGEIYFKNQKIEKEKILKNYDEILNIYNNEISYISPNNIIETTKVIEKNIKNLKENKVIEEEIVFINVKNKKVSFSDKLSGVVIVNGIEKYSKEKIEEFVNNSKIITLIGDFKNSKLQDIYERTSLFNKKSI